MNTIMKQILPFVLAAAGLAAVSCAHAQNTPLPVAVFHPPNIVSVLSPAYCSSIKGSTTIAFIAPGLTHASVTCWKQGPGFGTDSTVGAVILDRQGRGDLLFPADRYPHGPITVTITGKNDTITDHCYLLRRPGCILSSRMISRDLCQSQTLTQTRHITITNHLTAARISVRCRLPAPVLCAVRFFKSTLIFASGRAKRRTVPA
jgi:hypothetical protein